MTTFSVEVQTLINQLSLEKKVKLLSGEDAWTTYAMPEIGLRKMTLSDGPSGVRGPLWDERRKSLTLPSASCVSATWNLDHLYNIGVVSAQEARSKNVDVVLGPTINLHRSPRGGRHFEAYSEDPYLSGKLAQAYVSGVQDNGVAATLKHYIANDSENERMSVNVQVDQQTLHELYLQPFELAVREAKSWAVMASYNRINGTTATEHALLEDPLRSAWGFDGVVMSDWTAVRSVSDSANASLDLAMPGPETPWAQGLLSAVHSGEVSEATIDEKVGNILTLAQRVGALGQSKAKTPAQIDARKVIRDVAADGFVLVENNGVLPLKQGTQSVSIIGSHAVEGRIGGGGSATTIPHNPISPLKGLVANADDKLKIIHAVGYHSVDEMTDLPLDQIKTTAGNRAIEITWLDKDDNVLLVEDRFAGRYMAMSERVGDATKKVVGRTTFTAIETGLHRFGVSGIGHCKISINGEIKLNEYNSMVSDDILEALLAAAEKVVDVELEAGQSIDLEFEYIKEFPFEFGAIGLMFGYRAPRLDPELDMQLAVEAAKTTDVAVVVVGTTAHVESEGYDRSSLQLPGRQNELIEAVVAANPNTVVVVNAGSPVEMPWRKKVAAVLLTWFPGEEYGNALADVIYGKREPGGRLPTTWGETLEDAPISNTDPVDGVLVYNEGLNIGYRAWAKHAIEPAYHFGFGLGYTSWQISNLLVRANGDQGAIVQVDLANTGDRDGSDLVQIYLRKLDSAFSRPTFWLAGFAKAEVSQGKQQTLEISIDKLRFAHYSNGWQIEKGTYEVIASRSANLDGALISTVEI